MLDYHCMGSDATGMLDYYFMDFPSLSPSMSSGSVRPFFKVLAERFLDGVRKSDFLLEPRAELLEEHLG